MASLRQLKSDMVEALDNVQAHGTFASFQSISHTDFESPNIVVPGIGPINLPLREDQARQLISNARQAPYGKGSETVVDVSVRRTWELDPTQFSIQNPRWTDCVRRICRRVKKDMGIQGTIRSRLYKMLVYERGAMFKPHTDTEKIPNMFGTLIISLPSPHQGGDVVVRHCGEEKIFKTSTTNQSFACWCSDVTHEVQPVRSGYRWVLTYNLALDPDMQRPSATSLVTGAADTLRPLLERLLYQTPDHWYYRLDHDYTQANTSLDALKGKDSVVVQCLQHLSKDFEFDVFLALLEKYEKGELEYTWRNYGGYRGRGEAEEVVDEYGRHTMREAIEDGYRIMTLCDLEGNEVAEDISVDRISLLSRGRDFCDPEDFDEETDHESYMGNYGPSATHWYRLAAVLIAKRGGTFEDYHVLTPTPSPSPDGSDDDDNIDGSDVEGSEDDIGENYDGDSQEDDDIENNEDGGSSGEDRDAPGHPVSMIVEHRGVKRKAIESIDLTGDSD